MARSTLTVLFLPTGSMETRSAAAAPAAASGWMLALCPELERLAPEVGMAIMQTVVGAVAAESQSITARIALPDPLLLVAAQGTSRVAQARSILRQTINSPSY